MENLLPTFQKLVPAAEFVKNRNNVKGDTSTKSKQLTIWSKKMWAQNEATS